MYLGVFLTCVSSQLSHRKPCPFGTVPAAHGPQPPSVPACPLGQFAQWLPRAFGCVPDPHCTQPPPLHTSVLPGLELQQQVFLGPPGPN